ncbi:Murein hydrolase activator EnvC precursor [Candidatus Methylomirabilis lanthanidiphila]|uniref:Murein hydrolase activator EnvC n=1 Tax=Candidatus Methylomirabilis lanthanidiphila TaxID=2211376 RepID=A0A564ZLN6_9BACT|nr:peptidoglycan DD-metalloendopeptidase family protein [Candidatus Methylomirabilis lanthanidiphila]VUZ85468.1 Murein hydrolase activator EnvC precursor [Candidatus Methylomirabilis lanthanidiphila]
MVQSPLTRWVIIALIATLLVGSRSGLAADTKTGSSSRLREKRNELSQIKKELNHERKQARQVAQKERTLSDELDRINRELQQKGRELKDLQTRLKISAERLRMTQHDIGLTRTRLDRIQDLFRRRVRAIYKQGQHGYVQALLSSEDLSGAERRIRYLATIAHQDRQMVAAYTATIETLGTQQAELERSKAELTQGQKAVTEKREEILEEQQTRRVLLVKVQEEKKGHLAAVLELELAARELQRLIGRLQQQKRPQIGRAPRPIPPQASDRSEEPSGSFASLKGRLPWPTTGVLASTFGRQKHARYRTVTFNHGIEINAPEGQKIVSVSDGVALYVDWFKGYGRLIVLDHGEGYYTVYAHAAEVLVKAGDRVAKGQAIGSVGNTGSVTGSQLYFEIRYRGGPQNPVAWLAPM